MFVAAQQQQVANIISSCGSNWNMFLMAGTPPASLAEVPFQLQTMESVYANCIQALRLTAVNNATYGYELLVFENVGSLFSSKQHGARLLNNVSGIQCFPQSIKSDILGLDKPKGYVNGVEDSSRIAYASEHTVDGKYIEYDFGSACSINEVSYGMSTSSNNNATSIQVQYFDTISSTWLNAGTLTSIKSYVAAGTTISFTPILAQKWRVKFTGNGTNTSYPLNYRWLQFKASVLPEDFQSKEAELFTWAILVPYTPTESIYESVGATQLPMIILEAGGPLDLKPVVLNRGKAGVNDNVTSIHCKVFQSVVSEVEVTE